MLKKLIICVDKLKIVKYNTFVKNIYTCTKLYTVVIKMLLERFGKTIVLKIV